MTLRVRTLGLQEYVATWRAMQQFVDRREQGALDEIWLLEHQPVYTQGLNGRAEHIIDPGAIPVVQSDRGGQVTYHGPGQLIVYAMLDLQRLRLGVRGLVNALEQTAIGVLKQYGLNAVTRRGAPGVYIDGAKIASVGLRIRRGLSYHGLSLNVCLDPTPFKRINPCGFRGLPMIRLSDLVEGPVAVHDVSVPVIARLMELLGYNDLIGDGSISILDSVASAHDR